MAYIVNRTKTPVTAATSIAPRLGAHVSGDLLLLTATQDVGNTIYYLHTSTVTVNSGTDVITITGTDYFANGDRIWIWGSTQPGNTVFGTNYYIINKSGSTFQISTSSGGSAVNISSDGVSVGVYMQTTGASHPTPGWNIYYQTFAGSPTVRHGVIYKVATSSSETAPTIYGAASNAWAVSCLVIRDADQTTPIDSYATNGAGSGTTLTSPPLNTGANGCLIVYTIGWDGGGGTAIFRQLIDDARCDSREASGTAVRQAVSHVQQQSLGSVPSVTTYVTGTSAYVQLVIAVKNASSGALQPDIRPDFTMLRWYGNFSGFDTTTTWQASSNLTTDTIGSYGGGAIPIGTTLGVVGGILTASDPEAAWGGFYYLPNQFVPASSTIGAWVGGTHSFSSTDLSNSVFFVTLTHNNSSTDPICNNEGWLLVFADSSGYWTAYQVRTRDLTWYVGGAYTVTVALGNATPYAVDPSGSTNWADIVRIGYFWHRGGTSSAAYGLNPRQACYVKNAIPLTGGGADRPATFMDFADAIQSWGDFQFAQSQGSGQALLKCSVQIGDGGTNTTYFDASATATEFPPAFDNTSTRAIGWNADDQAVSVVVKAGASDTVRFGACVFATATQQNFTIDSASSTSATYDFSGTSFVGWNVTWKTGVACTGATFKNCGEIDGKGATFTDVSIIDTASTDAAIAITETGVTMTRVAIDVTGTSAAYHLELGASVTAITLNGVTFTGTPGTDKIHVKATSGTVTITVDGTGSSLVAGDVTSDGATVSIVSPSLERGQEFTGLVSGSFVRVVTSDNVTQKFEDLSSSTTETWDDASSGTVSVDYSVMKAGLIPIRVSGVSLTGAVGTGVVTTPVDQVEDRGYAASSGLTINTNVYGTVGTKKFGLTTTSTTQNFYSYFIEQWIALGNTGEAYANKDFPMASTGPTSFTMLNGWQFDLTTYPNSISNLSRGGLRYLNTSEAVTDLWAAILTAGVPAGLTVRYKHASTGAWSSAAATGNMDQLIKLIEDPNGDGSYADGFDRTGTMVVRVQGEGYDMAEVDVVGTFGTLSNYLYAIAPVPAANGVAAGNPTLSGSPAISVGTYTYAGLTFGIKIVDGVGGNSAEDLMRWIRYAQGQGGTFQGREANDWHDLIQTNGDSFKTVRGTIYGPTATKGVIVYQSDGTTLHSGFNLFTADNGSTYSPPVLANVSVTGMPNAASATTRLQILNQTAESATAWQATTAYSVGALRRRTTGLGTENTAGLYVRCTTAGTSGGAEPTWNTTVGGTTTDGTVTWTTYAILFYDGDPAAASYSATYTEGNEFLAGETVEIKFAEMVGATSFSRYHSTTLAASTGFAFVVAEEADDVYATNALDGSSYDATFSPNYTSDYIVLDTNTDFSGKSAYAYFCYLLTTSQGMYEFWDGITALDTGNYRIETDVLSLYFDESAGFVKQTDDVRIFRKDGTRPALDPTTGGNGIEINWRTPVSVVTTGGSALTPTESAHLLSLPTASDVWTYTLP